MRSPAIGSSQAILDTCPDPIGTAQSERAREGESLTRVFAFWGQRVTLCCWMPDSRMDRCMSFAMASAKPLRLAPSC